MEVTRRSFLLSLAPGWLSLLGCSRATRSTKVPSELHTLSASHSNEQGGGVLVCMPDTLQTKQVLVGLSDEIAGEFPIVAVHVEGRGGSGTIAQAIRKYRPQVIVLMNNPTVAAYRDYVRKPGAVHGLPAVVVMTSLLDRRQLEHINALGISYEVPLITVATNLRRIVLSPVTRVGVIYRRPFAGFVEKQRELAEQEQIQTVEELVSIEPNTSEIKRALRLVKERADVLWVLNDDKLLTPELLAEGWLVGIDEKPWRPTIVGAGSLVSPQRSFGTFAVLPDHTALGVQAASLVFEIADNDFRLPRDPTADFPLSTTMTIDITQARERFRLRSNALAQVDRVLDKP